MSYRVFQKSWRKNHPTEGNPITRSPFYGATRRHSKIEVQKKAKINAKTFENLYSSAVLASVGLAVVAVPSAANA